MQQIFIILLTTIRQTLILIRSLILHIWVSIEVARFRCVRVWAVCCAVLFYVMLFHVFSCGVALRLVAVRLCWQFQLLGTQLQHDTLRMSSSHTTGGRSSDGCDSLNKYYCTHVRIFTRGRKVARTHSSPVGAPLRFSELQWSDGLRQVTNIVKPYIQVTCNHACQHSSWTCLTWLPRGRQSA